MKKGEGHQMPYHDYNPVYLEARRGKKTRLTHDMATSLVIW